MPQQISHLRYGHKTHNGWLAAKVLSAMAAIGLCDRRLRARVRYNESPQPGVHWVNAAYWFKIIYGLYMSKSCQYIGTDSRGCKPIFCHILPTSQFDDVAALRKACRAQIPWESGPSLGLTILI